MSRNKITIKEIAERANVSIGTVDRVLHNRGRVSEENESRIKAIIEETGYVPNWHASSLSSRKVTTIAVLMPDLRHENGFWDIPRRGIEKAVEDIQSHTVEIRYYYYNRFESQSFKEQSKILLEQLEDFDGILLAPVITSLGNDFLKEINGELPVVLFDSPLPQTSPVCYVGHDSFGSGQLAGRLLHLLTSGSPRLAVIRSSETDYHINERISGLKEFLNRNSIVDLIEEFSLNTEKRDLGYSKLFQELEVGRFNSFFVSDASVHFIAQYLDKNGIRNCSLVGYDLTPENIHYLEKGVIDFIISQRSESQGYQGVMNLYKTLIQKIEVPRQQLLPMDIITVENLPYFRDL